MKLPGIEYGPVQKLGRYDTQAPAREAAVTGAMHSTNVSISRAIGQHAQTLYNSESERQFNRAKDKYNTIYDAQMVSIDITEDIWQDREAVFSDASANAGIAAEAQTMTGLAREKMREFKSAQTVKNKKVWDEQNHAWWLEDGLAQAHVVVADAVGSKDWQLARDSVKNNMIFFGRVNGEKTIGAIDNAEVFDNFEMDTKLVNVRNPEQGARTAKLHQEIQEDSKLSLPQKSQLKAKVNQEVVTAYRDNALLAGNAVRAEKGLVGAINRLTEMSNKVWGGKAEEFGGDLMLQHAIVDGINKERQHFIDLYNELEKDKGVAVRGLQYMHRLISKDWNVQQANDISAYLLGARPSENGVLDINDRYPNADADILSNIKIPSVIDGTMLPWRDAAIQAVLLSQHVDKNFSNFLSANARKSPEGMEFAMKFVNELTDMGPYGHAALNSLPLDNDLKQVKIIMDTYGVSNPPLVHQLLVDGYQISNDQRKAFWDQKDQLKDFQADFTSETADLLNDAGGMWFSTPEVRTGASIQLMKLGIAIQETHQTFTPKQVANAAMELFLLEHSQTTVGTDSTMTKNAAEIRFAIPKLTRAENADWVEENVRAQALAMGKELPENFKYTVVQREVPIKEAIQGSGLPDSKVVAALQPYTIDEVTGARITWPAYVPIFKNTSLYKEKQQIKIRQIAAEKNAAESEKLRAERAIELANNPPAIGADQDIAKGKKAFYDAMHHLGGKAAWSLFSASKIFNDQHGNTAYEGEDSPVPFKLDRGHTEKPLSETGKKSQSLLDKAKNIGGNK